MIPRYYSKGMAQLDMYQRMVQYTSLAFERVDRNVHMTDVMNFNGDVFEHVLDPIEVMQMHRLEPGYGTPDGSLELEQVIRRLECARLDAVMGDKGRSRHQLIDAAGIGVGPGCTGVMHGLLNAVLEVTPVRSRTEERPEVILFLPCYTVYAAQLSHLRSRVDPVLAQTDRVNSFLPVFDDLQRAVSDRTAAVILTYPTNPSQATYEGENVHELTRIIEFCQEREIFLIVDNVYQDTMYPRGSRQHAEVFAHTDRLDYVAKVYGCSKDTPYYSGYRNGYWIGDPRLQDAYRYCVSATENTPNQLGIIMFAVNLYFKSLILEGADPVQDDMALFADGIFGFTSILTRVAEGSRYSEAYDTQRMFDTLCSLDLYGKYRRNMEQAGRIQYEANQRMRAFAESSRVLSDFVNQELGNVFFMRANPEIFHGDDHQLFHLLLDHARIGVMPGNIFGLEMKPGEAWFRVTLAHNSIDSILDDMSRAEHAITQLRANGGALVR